MRKVALEESSGNRSLADAKVDAARKALSGFWAGNWMAYNVGHDVQPPGSNEGAQNFLMYAEAEIAGVRLDCLDPDAFRYAITSCEIRGA